MSYKFATVNKRSNSVYDIQYKKIELYTNCLLIFTFGNFMIIIKLCSFAFMYDAYGDSIANIIKFGTIFTRTCYIHNELHIF